MKVAGPAAGPRLRNEPSAAPMLMAATGIFILAAMDALLKDATTRFSVVQIIFLRFAFGSVFAGLAFAHARRPFPRGRALRVNFFRAVAAVLSGLTFVYAMSVLPLAQAVALAYTTAFFMVLFGWLVLGERLTRAILTALVIGLAGILVILSAELFGGSGASALGVISAIASAATYAVAMILVRQRTAHDPIETIVLLQNVFCTLLLLPFVVFAWRTPAAAALGIFVLIGICGVAGHLFITWGYARANASRLAPLEYTGLLWATLFSIVFFGEELTPRTVLGGALIVLSGVVIARAKSRRTEPSAAEETAPGQAGAV